MRLIRRDEKHRIDWEFHAGFIFTTILLIAFTWVVTVGLIALTKDVL